MTSPAWCAVVCQPAARPHPGLNPPLDAADLLLPMPLSRQRWQERGYNQALLLAQQLEPSKTRADLLLRIPDTPAQHTLKRAQRLTAPGPCLCGGPVASGTVAEVRAWCWSMT